MERADVTIPITRTGFFQRLKQPAWFAFGIALALHAVWGLMSVFIFVGGGGFGSAGGGGTDVEFAVMSETELAAEAAAGSPLGLPEIPEAIGGGGASEPLSVGAVGEVIDDGGISETGVLPVSGGAGDVSSGQFGSGGGTGAGGAGAGGASFFGVEAYGNRFAYVVDVSGSMGVVGKIEALRSQLLKSVNALTENAQFLVVPFSSDAAALGNRREWVEASNTGKRWAKNQIPALAPAGGTNPQPGFEIVFAVRPRPDAIYFMTDGEFDPSVADEIALLNAQLKIPIHCICFASRDSEELMRKIASQSKGTFTFVPGP